MTEVTSVTFFPIEQGDVLNIDGVDAVVVAVWQGPGVLKITTRPLTDAD